MEIVSLESKFICPIFVSVGMATIDEEIKSRFDNDRHRFVTNIIFTANWVQNAFTNQLKPYGISTQQYNIMRILRGGGDWMAMTDVKSRMLEKSPNATRLADKLVSKGLIERNRSESDRRVVYVRITKSGLQIMADIEETVNPIKYAMENNITDEEARMASAVIDKFRG